MENPYSLVFGKMPSNYIDRELELNEIIETIVISLNSDLDMFEQTLEYLSQKKTCIILMR